ncbi:unnamed protein product [Acanthoscelides obtectus]|nr:unnamed protein product [Acanthoscelides obtectus]CAK1648689.1 hypothetical protein AOBTE_LOCUS15822 [Acanthoscelides obtectus]
MIKANSTKSPFINGGNSKILSRSNIQASSKITFTVGNDVKGLYFEFRPSSIQGTIVSPDGFTINIQNDLEVSQFGGRSTAPTARSNQELREIHLNGVTSATTKRVAGQWRIDLTGVEGENYDVDVFAVNDMDDELTTEASSTNISASVEDFHKSKHDGKIIFEGSNTNLSNASVKESENIIMDVEFWNATVFTKKEDAPPSIANMKGNMSSHAALNNGYSQVNTEVFQMPTLLINIVQGSELIIPEGGRTAVIVFKITNNKNTDLGVTLSCQDQRYILQSLKPWRLNLTPLQTATSTLTMSIRPGTYEDELTMYARTGSEVIEKKVIVDVGKAINDYTEPYMDYNFLSDCSRVIFSDCSQGTWTIEVEARDIGSGLLDVTSNPPGLYFPNGFVSGTKENVRGVYSDSCCNADIQLSATDRTNNRKVLYANAYRAAWSPAQISALVIGLILLIVIIIIIVLIVKKYRKKRESLDLPRYRGGTSSRNI